jgi:hypothetical protein
MSLYVPYVRLKTMAAPLNLIGLEGLNPALPELCTLEASCVTGFEPMSLEEIQVLKIPGAVWPDCVIPLDSPLLGHQSLYVFNILIKF